MNVVLKSLPRLSSVAIAASGMIAASPWLTAQEPPAPAPSLEDRVRRIEEHLNAPPAQSKIENPKSQIPSNVHAPGLERLDIGGQVRLRAEARDAADYRRPGAFGRPASDGPGDNDDFMLSRIRLHFDARVDKQIRAFIQIQDSRTFGQEASVVANDANLGLHQGYLEVANLLADPLTLRAGRMELSYGDQRLVSPLDWHNVGRAFDAGLLRWKEGAWLIDLFSAVIVEGDTSNHDRDFHGLYASCTAVENHTVDAYAFHRRFADESFASEAGLPGDLADSTFGGRVAGKLGGIDYGAEAAWQTGAIVRDPVRAWAAAATAEYTFAEGPWTPRVGVELDHATGDRDATDGRRQSFDPLFPFGHKYQGFADVFSWRNGTDLALILSAKPAEGMVLGLDLHAFRLDEKEDAWYGSTATPIRRDAAGGSGRSVGSEADLHLKWKVHEKIGLWTGYSRFAPGSYVRRTGASPPMDWIFLQATLDF